VTAFIDSDFPAPVPVNGPYDRIWKACQKREDGEEDFAGSVKFPVTGVKILPIISDGRSSLAGFGFAMLRRRVHVLEKG
jgi:hypothetical protein